MVTDLAKQLDLVVYEGSPAAWWCAWPVVVGLGALFTLGFLGYWWYSRRIRARAVVALPDQIFDLLSSGLEQFEHTMLSSADMAALIVSCLKAYTAWRCDYDHINALTDVQWLDYVRQNALFGGVYDSCQNIVQAASFAKFYGALLSAHQVHEMVDQVMYIIKNTLPEK